MHGLILGAHHDIGTPAAAAVTLLAFVVTIAVARLLTALVEEPLTAIGRRRLFSDLHDESCRIDATVNAVMNQETNEVASIRQGGGMDVDGDARFAADSGDRQCATDTRAIHRELQAVPPYKVEQRRCLLDRRSTRSARQTLDGVNRTPLTSNFDDRL